MQVASILPTRVDLGAGARAGTAASGTRRPESVGSSASVVVHQNDYTIDKDNKGKFVEQVKHAINPQRESPRKSATCTPPPQDMDWKQLRDYMSQKHKRKEMVKKKKLLAAREKQSENLGLNREPSEKKIQRYIEENRGRA